MNPAAAKMAGQIALSLVRSRTGQRLLVAVLVLQLVALTIILWLPTYFASVTATSVQRVVIAPASNCGTDTGPSAPDGTPPPKVSDLTPKQVEVARTIYYTAQGVGRRLKWSPAKIDRAVLVALVTAKQESQLGAYPGIERPNGDGDAGVFQQRQRPGWYGTLAQVTRVDYAARIFLGGKKLAAADVAAARRAGSTPAGPVGYTIPGLQQVRRWETLPLTVAAQRVQRSAFPDAYAQHERIATTLLTVFNDKLEPQSAAARLTAESTQCGPTGALTCAATGRSAEVGLKPDALRVLRCTARGWPQVTTYYGVGSRPNVSDHPGGRAVDIMIPDYTAPGAAALGDEISRWLLANRKNLGVKYVIWNRKIWSEVRAGEGWRPYSGISPHIDHVHVSTYGDSAGADVLPGGASGDTSGDRTVLPLDSFVLTKRFGECGPLWANCHTGLDFSAGTGTPLKSVSGGRVVSTAYNTAYGRLTKIEARPGEQFWYAHQSVQNVRVGDVVRPGQEIGRVGKTGNTTGPHLHLERRVGGRATDPEVWLRKQGLLDD